MIAQGSFICSDPESADIYQLRLKEGDIVIMASDGLFDNLFESEIQKIIKNCL